jgi:hypothetical protein
MESNIAIPAILDSETRISCSSSSTVVATAVIREAAWPNQTQLE